MSKSAWIHIIFGNACSTLGLWVEKIGGSEIFLILIPYLGPLVHSAPSCGLQHKWICGAAPGLGNTQEKPCLWQLCGQQQPTGKGRLP